MHPGFGHLEKHHNVHIHPSISAKLEEGKTRILKEQHSLELITKHTHLIERPEGSILSDNQWASLLRTVVASERPYLPVPKRIENPHPIIPKARGAMLTNEEWRSMLYTRLG